MFGRKSYPAVITTLSSGTSCFGTAPGARRKPKRHARQGVQVFFSALAVYTLPARRNDSFLLSRSRKIIKARQALAQFFPQKNNLKLIDGLRFWAQFNGR